MIKKLVRHGNSWALVIEKPVMELLQWEGSREVEIVTEGRSLIITSVSQLTVDTDPQREKLASARAYAREALAGAEQEREQAEAKARTRRGPGARPGDAWRGPSAAPGDAPRSGAPSGAEPWDALWDEDPGTSG